MADQKIIPFTESGMRSFGNVNEAVKYFRSQKPARSLKSIIWLWQQSFEVNAGNVSILVFDYKSNPESFKKRVESLLKSKSQQMAFEKSFKIWIDKLNGIKRIPTNVVNRIIEETKTIR